MTLPAFFAMVGVFAGVPYAILGLMALGHPASSSSLDESDKVVGWTLWWWVETQKYDPAGRRLCRFGGALFVVAVASWIAWVAAGYADA